jgi:hypothetical protein
LKDIQEGTNFQIRMDSSNAFTFWDEVFIDKQQALASSIETPPEFVYPLWWGDSDPGFEDEEQEISAQPGSYSYQKNKSPIVQYPGMEQGVYYDMTGYDKGVDKLRIPIREVFINVEMIVEAFRTNKNLREVLTQILEKINEASYGTFDWKIITGNNDAEFELIDNNFINTQNKINEAGSTNDDETGSTSNSEFDNLFIFDIMSKGSIVKDYSLNFKLPSDNIGNMYAIQAMSHDSAKIFPLSQNLEQAVGIASLDAGDLSVVHLPDSSGYRLSKITADQAYDSSLVNTYREVNNVLDEEKHSILTDNSSIPLYSPQEREKLNAKSQKQDPHYDANKHNDTETQDRLIEIANDKLTMMDLHVVNSITDYFDHRILQEIKMKRIASLLPYNLSLTTYGMATIQPGDTFRVNYLPLPHFQNTYAQTMKVTHTLDSSGWYTALDTQYRIKPEVKSFLHGKIDRDKIRLSPKILDKYELVDYFFPARAFLMAYMGHPDGSYAALYNMTYPIDGMGIARAHGPDRDSERKNSRTFRRLWPYFTHMRPLGRNELEGFEHITSVFKFVFDKDYKGDGKKGDGVKNDKPLIGFPFAKYIEFVADTNFFNMASGNTKVKRIYGLGGYVAPWVAAEGDIGYDLEQPIYYKRNDIIKKLAPLKGITDKGEVYGGTSPEDLGEHSQETLRTYCELIPGHSYYLVINGPWWCIVPITDGDFGRTLKDYDKDVSYITYTEDSTEDIMDTGLYDMDRFVDFVNPFD